ncbi:uncharacterized protein G2W53_029559 [Senna tora]|uniref:Uncharacterized protein n=1 Tax=Senna tora TaxID=362788 RepID=A0A834T4X4_9FABA|nr:uncharacterized protein G2W53_029559 [Senna tora]
MGVDSKAMSHSHIVSLCEGVVKLHLPVFVQNISDA